MIIKVVMRISLYELFPKLGLKIITNKALNLTGSPIGLV